MATLQGACVHVCVRVLKVVVVEALVKMTTER